MDFNFLSTCQLESREVYKTAESLKHYIRDLMETAEKNSYETPESFINLPFDEQMLKSVLELKERYVSSKLKYILVIGIGGDSLGTKGIYDALLGNFDIFENDRYPKLIFMDTINSRFREKLLQLLNQIKDPEELLINAISKSGSTMETRDNLDFILENLSYAKDRLICITTASKNNEMWNYFFDKSNVCLKIENKVGGRYSLLSPVGLLPLACTGINIIDLLEGAMEMRKVCIDSNVENNFAALSSASVYLNYKKDKDIYNLFFFHPELESTGKYCSQLIAESLGKEKDLNGKTVNVGITPITSVGTTDLHSMEQLYLGGPKDKFTSFVFTRELENEKKVFALLKGVEKTYDKHKMPYSEVVLNKIDARSLGEFIMFKQIETIFLGKLLNINAFDQPAVEEYKKETQKLLNQ